MEPRTDRNPSTSPASGLRVQLARWVTSAESRLRVGGEWPVAAALREGVALAAEALRTGEAGEAGEEVRGDAREDRGTRLAHLAELFEQVPVALLVTARGRVREANAEALRLVGGGRLALVGRPLVEHVALEDRHAFRGLLADAAGGRGVRECPLRLRAAPRRVRDVVATVRSLGGRREPELCWALREDRRVLGDDLL